MTSALRASGSVVVLRHSYPPGSFDPPDARLEDCSTQRNLDADGRAQARRLGEVFRQQGIVVGRVLASPRCRCLDNQHADSQVPRTHDPAATIAASGSGGRVIRADGCPTSHATDARKGAR